jgi:hypothetical protein
VPAASAKDADLGRAAERTYRFGTPQVEGDSEDGWLFLFQK